MMRRREFEPPTNHYDNRIQSIDHQICSLIQHRKELSNNNPGFPPLQQIALWAKEFGLYEDFLRALFSHLRNEDRYRPYEEPDQFLKLIPILRSTERDGVVYTVTYIRQYNNASLVYVHADQDPTSVAMPRAEHRHGHRHFALSVGEEFECRNQGAGGSPEAYTYRFVVTPALPDTLYGIGITLYELKSPFGDPTGFEVEFQLV